MPNSTSAFSPAPSPRTSSAAAASPTVSFLRLLLVITLTAPGQLSAVELVIVIDDVGYSLERAERIVELPGPVTLGLLPYAPHALEAAELAHVHRREIILHQPMQPVADTRVADEPGTLRLDMTEARFDSAFNAALARLPGIRGVNNHTGSLLTAEARPMDWLMAGIARRGLFFLDSRTTPHTVAETMAREHDVPTVHRDVFLDHVQTPEFLEQSFALALAIARRRGHAVVIGHPHRLTLDFLEARLENLPRDVRLTTLEALLAPSPRAADRTVLALPGSPMFPSR